MRGGSIFAGARVVGVGVNLVWRTNAGDGSEASPCESGVERPCSVGILSERVEALGGGRSTTWTPVVGLADETSARSRLCGVPLVRSSRRQPSTTEGPGGGDRPQGGAPLHLLAAEQTWAAASESVTY